MSELKQKFLWLRKRSCQQHPREANIIKGHQKDKLSNRISTSEVKPRKQAKNTMQSEVSNLTTQQQIIYDQLLKLCWTLGRGKKVEERQQETNGKLEIKKQIESRLMNYERDFEIFQNISTDQNSSIQHQKQKQKELIDIIENRRKPAKIAASNGTTRIRKQPNDYQRKKFKIQTKRESKRCYYCNSRTHQLKICQKFQILNQEYQNYKEKLKKKRRENRSNQLQIKYEEERH